MTTVAWRGSVLATDSALTCGNMQGKFTKLLKMRGMAYGFCGDADQVVRTIALLSMNTPYTELKKVKGDIGILVLTTDGCLMMDNDMQPIPVENEFWAMGSGAEYAMGAMAAGKNAKQAVEIACQFDPGSRLPLQHATVRQRSK